MAIDLGTANTLIYSRGRGIILNEPSAIAVNKDTGRVVCVGREATLMLGREPYDTVVHRPMKDGTIADYDLAEKMLRTFFHNACRREYRRYCKLVVSIPSSATQTERRALRNAAHSVGANKVYLIDEGLAAAMGAEVMLRSPHAQLLVDIGGGTTNITIATMTGIIASKSLEIAGTRMTQDIIEYLHRKHKLVVDEQTAEQIKINLGAAIEQDRDVSMLVAGKSLSNYKIREMNILQSEVVEALDHTLSTIIEGVRQVIELSKPAVAVDIHRTGVTLAGGGSLLRDLNRRFHLELGLPAQRASHPMEAVVTGAGMLLDRPELLKRFAGADLVRNEEWVDVPDMPAAG
ncbi:MAG: rod shape-determining protein [Blastocatellia bacterium]|nr:rod shape-determining protein [Blastocatellia bacterium]